MTVLVTGVAGSLASQVARELTKTDDVVGVDLRPMRPERSFPGRFQQLKRYNSRPMAEVFRRYQPETLVHLGIRGFAPRSMSARYTQNVLGTKTLLDNAVRYGVKRVVVLSTFHVYGAHQHNPVNIREDAPLRASQVFPELADSVELDHLATTFLWKHRDITTVVLRPCHLVGPSLNNRISRLLRLHRVPKLLGFDPMLQFLGEEDARSAILAAARGSAHGVYNVSGEGAVAYSHAVSIAGGRQLVVPRALVGLLVAGPTRTLFPVHLMDFFRYPTVIDDRAFREQYGWRPRYTMVEALRSLRG